MRDRSINYYNDYISNPRQQAQRYRQATLADIIFTISSK